MEATAKSSKPSPSSGTSPSGSGAAGQAKAQTATESGGRDISSSPKEQPAMRPQHQLKPQDLGRDQKIVFDGITFDDVLLVPSRSSVLPAEANTVTKLTQKIA